MPNNPVLTLRKFYDDIALNHGGIVDFGWYKVGLELYYDLPDNNHTLMLSFLNLSGTITEFKSAYPIGNKTIYYMLHHGDINVLQTNGDISQAVANLSNILIANSRLDGPYREEIKTSGDNSDLISYAYEFDEHPKLLTMHYDRNLSVIFMLRGGSIIVQPSDLPEWRSIIVINGRNSDDLRLFPGFNRYDLETIELGNKFLTTIQNNANRERTALNKLRGFQKLNNSHEYQINNSMLTILQQHRYDKARHDLAYDLAMRISGKSDTEFAEFFGKFKLNRSSSDLGNYNSK